MAARKPDGDVVDALVENRIVLLVARIGMPLVMALLLWLAQGWVATLDTLGDRTTALEQRMALREASAAQAREDREAFQSAMVAEMREMRAAIASLTARVSALDATLQAMRDRAEAAPQSDLIRRAETDPAATDHP